MENHFRIVIPVFHGFVYNITVEKICTNNLTILKPIKPNFFRVQSVLMYITVILEIRGTNTNYRGTHL